MASLVTFSAGPGVYTYMYEITVQSSQSAECDVCATVHNGATTYVSRSDGVTTFTFVIADTRTQGPAEGRETQCSVDARLFP